MHERAEQLMVLTQPRAHNIAFPPERPEDFSQGFDVGIGWSALKRHEQSFKNSGGSFTIFDAAGNLPNRK